MTSQADASTAGDARTLQLTQLSVILVGGLPIVVTALLVTRGMWGFIGLVLPFMAALLVLMYTTAGRLAARGKAYGWLLSLVIFVSIFVTFEASLRLVGFRYAPGIQFGFPRPSQFQYFSAHPELFWTYDSRYVDINSFGFRDDEIELPRPDDVRTVIFMGDSVTDQGIPAAFEQVMLERWPDAQAIDALKIAVPGYSSHQGRVLTDLYGEMLDADLVVVYYGWNDHWRAYGAIDSEKEPVEQSDFEITYRAIYTWQFLRYIAQAGSEPVPLEAVRVPLDQYEENLAHIVDFYDQRDVPVMMITAPTTYYTIGVPEYIVELKYADSPEQISQLHREYNAVVREISARYENAVLLDLEPRYEALSSDTLTEVFMTDGIHLTPSGIERMAAEIAAAVVDGDLLAGGD